MPSLQSLRRKISGFQEYPKDHVGTPLRVIGHPVDATR